MVSPTKCPIETAIVTNKSTFCGSCLWSIYNYSFSVNNEHHTPISSPTFAVGPRNELKWNLKLYPHSYENYDKDYMSICVEIFEITDYKEVIAKCEIAILDDNGVEQNIVKTKSLHNFKKKWVIKDFITKDCLTNKRNTFLPNDKLTLYCKLDANVSYEMYEEDKSHAYYQYKSKLEVSHNLKLLMNGNFFDVLFLVGGEKLYLHKAILASRSHIFDAMFKHKMSEKESNIVHIKDISYIAFHKMIQYIYSGIIDDINQIPHNILIELFMAADKYELSYLKDLCELVFFRDLNFENAFDMLSFADTHNANKLKSQIIQFIVAHNKDFVHERAFETFSETHAHLLPLLIKEVTTLENYLEHWFWDCFDIEEEPPVDKVLIEGKNWGITELCVNKFSYTWKIDNLNFFLKTEEVRELILSQDFTQDFGKVTWQLSLFSKKIENSAEDYVALYIEFLYNNNNNKIKEIQAQYEFIALNNKGNEIKRVKSNVLTFIANSKQFGDEKFLEKNFLLAYLSENDSLTIKCNITRSMNENRLICQTEPMNCDVAKYQLGVSRDCEYFLTDEKFHDISVIVGEKKFNLHRAMLSVRSPTFLQILDLHLEKKGKLTAQGELTIEINYITADVLEQLLIFIYCGYVNELSKFAKELFIESKRYNLQTLESICESYLLNHLDIENSCDNFVFAYLNNASKLRYKSIVFIIHNLDLVIKTSGYKSLEQSRPRLLKDILCKL